MKRLNFNTNSNESLNRAISNYKLNERVRKAVKNFNEKQRRVEASGKGYAPERASVREIKRRYTKRSELLKEVALLERFNKMGKSAYQVIENKAGGRTNRWRYEYMKSWQKEALNYWQNRLAYQQKLYESDFHYPVRQENVENTKKIVQLLSTNLEDLETSKMKSFQWYIKKMQQEKNLRATDYRNFMSRIDEVMDNLGYSEQFRNEFFNKFTKLNPDQFWKMYQESNILRDIYETIIPSPDKVKRPISEEDAQNKILTLVNHIDETIEKYKKEP